MTREQIAKAIKKVTKTKANVKHLEVLVEMFITNLLYDAKYCTYSLFSIGLEIQGDLVVTYGDYGKHVICYKDELPKYTRTFQ